MGKPSKKPQLKMLAILAKDWSHSVDYLGADHCQRPMPAWAVGMLTYEGDDFIEISQLHFYRDRGKRSLLSLTKESIVKIFELNTGRQIQVRKKGTYKIRKTIFKS